MPTIEIPRGEWVEFFNNFSSRHEGWLVTVEVIGSDIGAQVEAAQLPLDGISADLKGGENRIEVAAGIRPESHVIHVINEPTRVYLQQTEGGADAALEIEAADGTRTLVRFRATARAETVDML